MPTRSQIRSELGKQRFTDAQMRGAIARLGLPGEDNTDYTPEQAGQIKSALLSVANGHNGHKPETPETPDYSQYRQQNANTLTGALTVATSNHAGSLQAVDRSLDDFETRFAQAFVQRVDEIPIRIEAKIAQIFHQRQVAATPPTLDLAPTVEGAIAEVPSFQLPDFTQSAIAGCLPY